MWTFRSCPTASVMDRMVYSPKLSQHTYSGSNLNMTRFERIYKATDQHFVSSSLQAVSTRGPLISLQILPMGFGNSLHLLIVLARLPLKRKNSSGRSVADH